MNRARSQFTKNIRSCLRAQPVEVSRFGELVRRVTPHCMAYGWHCCWHWRDAGLCPHSSVDGLRPTSKTGDRRAGKRGRRTFLRGGSRREGTTVARRQRRTEKGPGRRYTNKLLRLAKELEDEVSRAKSRFVHCRLSCGEMAEIEKLARSVKTKESDHPRRGRPGVSSLLFAGVSIARDSRFPEAHIEPMFSKGGLAGLMLRAFSLFL